MPVLRFQLLRAQRGARGGGVPAASRARYRGAVGARSPGARCTACSSAAARRACSRRRPWDGVLELARRHLTLRGGRRDHPRGQSGHHRARCVRRNTARRASTACRSAHRASMRARSRRSAAFTPRPRRAGRRRSCTPRVSATSTSTSCTRCPDRTRSGALRDVRDALALAPAHLSHYQLTLEPGTVFAAQPPPLPDEDAAADMLAACAEDAGARRLRPVRGLGVRTRRHAVPPQPQLLELRGLPGGRRRGARQAHGPRARADHPHDAAARSAPLPWPLPMWRWRAARSRRPSCPSNSCSMRCGCARALPPRRSPSAPGLNCRAIAAPLAAAVQRGLVLSTTTGYRPTPLGLRFLNDTLLALHGANRENVR